MEKMRYEPGTMVARLLPSFVAVTYAGLVVEDVNVASEAPVGISVIVEGVGFRGSLVVLFFVTAPAGCFVICTLCGGIFVPCPRGGVNRGSNIGASAVFVTGVGAPCLLFAPLILADAIVGMICMGG
jgi:hypothetical protein